MPIATQVILNFNGDGEEGRGVLTDGLSAPHAADRPGQAFCGGDSVNRKIMTAQVRNGIRRLERHCAGTDKRSLVFVVCRRYTKKGPGVLWTPGWKETLCERMKRGQPPQPK